MKSLKTVFALLLIVIPILFQSACKKTEEDCADTPCLAVFTVITVTITDSTQAPVALDYFKVIDLKDGSDVELYNYDLEMAQTTGKYPLINDGVIKPSEFMDFQFKGFIDSVEVVSSRYRATVDCCGVELLFGRTELTVNL